MSAINKNQNKVNDLQTPLKITAFFHLFEVAITGTGSLTDYTHALHKRPKKNYGKPALYLGPK